MKSSALILSAVLGLAAYGCSSENTSFYSFCEDGMPMAGLSEMLVMAAVQGVVCDDAPPKQSFAHQQGTTVGYEDCRKPFAEISMLADEEFHKQFDHCRSANDTTQWVWVCVAAHRHDPEAQDQIGQYYFWGYQPIQQDYVEAYKWSLLATKSRQIPDSAYLAMMRTHVTQQQAADAQSLATNWQPHEEECNPVQIQSP